MFESKGRGETMFCKNCGEQISDHAKFCPKCGIEYQSVRIENTISKTNIGISTKVLGAIVYLSGLVSPIVLTLIIGYILLMEQDKKLKGDALKAGYLHVAFFLLTAIVNVVINCLDILEMVLNWFTRIYINFPLSLDVICLNGLEVAKIVIVWFAVSVTLGGSGFHISKIDRYVEENW